MIKDMSLLVYKSKELNCYLLLRLLRRQALSSDHLDDEASVLLDAYDFSDSLLLALPHRHDGVVSDLLGLRTLPHNFFLSEHLDNIGTTFLNGYNLANGDLLVGELKGGVVSDLLWLLLARLRLGGLGGSRRSFGRGSDSFGGRRCSGPEGVGFAGLDCHVFYVGDWCIGELMGLSKLV